MAFGGTSWRHDVAEGARSRVAAAVAALALAAIHADRFAWAARQAPYLGLLFLIPIATYASVAIQLALRDNGAAWSVGAAIACATALAYVLSTTVGLPGLEPQRWTLLGAAGLALEGVVVALALARVLRRVEEG
jgi:hypothetical protein